MDIFSYTRFVRSPGDSRELSWQSLDARGPTPSGDKHITGWISVVVLQTIRKIRSSREARAARNALGCSKIVDRDKYDFTGRDGLSHPHKTGYVPRGHS